MNQRLFIIILFVLFAIANLTDLITAMSGYSAYEANPVFMATKSWVIPIILKISAILLFCYFLLFKKNYSSRLTYYVFILAATYGIVLASFGAYTNIASTMRANELIALNQSLPPPPEPQAAKTFYYALIGIFFLIPATISIIAFYVYDKSLKFVKIKKSKSDMYYIQRAIKYAKAFLRRKK